MRFLLLAAAVGTSTAGLPAAQVPFVLPWDDSTPSAADLSSWNRPIGPADRVGVDAQGRFTVGGQRIRFVGVNFAANSPFTPTNRADAVAARVAKFGVNCVRFHHMDAPWAWSGGLIHYGSGTSRVLSPTHLERLQYLVWRLGAHGVYANLNLLVGRQFKKNDGLPAEIETMDWKDQHVLGFFDDTALALHKEYATRLLTPTNRFSGLPLARDPAVAFVEIMNENGMLQKWFEGVLDQLPEVFASRLQTRWNSWLAQRYPDDAALLAAWQPIDEALGTNRVRNGTFTNGFNYWNREQHSGAVASFTVTNQFSGQPAARVEITTPGAESWHVQLNQPGLGVSNGQAYTFRYWARASEPLGLSVSLMQAHADWQPVGYTDTVSLTTNWQEFSATFQATSTDSNVRPNFGGFATRRVTVWIADVRLQTGGKIGVLPAGASLAARNIPNVAYHAPQAFTAGARRDWIRFLCDLEQRYWEEMARHVRDDCGYPGLIFGTILANSPPGIQSRLDVVDAHAYWQHPVFPGTPWDAVNWTVANVSLVNTLGSDNPLNSLARQRVKGKPFTVTEYQHPSPNYYAAEGPLLLAAYASLQDWDGLWLYEYGPGSSDLGTMGCFRGFFDVGQHPTKMVNLMLAAALFRRGDVRPALNELTMAVTPELELETILRRGGAWQVMDGASLGVPDKIGLASRLSLSVGTNATGLTTPPAAPAGSVVVSDTGELRWDLATAGRGVVTLDTPRAKALIGFTDNRWFDLGGPRFRPATTQLGWSTLSLVLLEGANLTNGGRALLAACGQVDNTGMQWKDAQKNSLGSNWGREPVLVEGVPFSLTIPADPMRVKVTALDERGRLRTPLPVTGTNGAALVTVDTNTATLWYEVRVSGDSAFERWRFLHFTAAELAEPGLSGEAAAPAGDGVANLLKYALGLPPKTPVHGGVLTGVLWPFDGIPHFATVFPRSKQATDVAFLAETSTNLVDWQSGPTTTRIVDVTDFGDWERVTEMDQAPLMSATRRFMRLKVVRIP